MKNLWRFVLTGAVVAAVCALPTAFAASRDASPSSYTANPPQQRIGPVPRHPFSMRTDCPHADFGLTCYGPAEMHEVYGIPSGSGSDGSGQTILIVTAFGNAAIASDLAAFDSYFGLPAPPSLAIEGRNVGDPSNPELLNWIFETTLDVEWAHAIAPGANIVLVVAKSDEAKDVNRAIEKALPKYPGAVITQSFGAPEQFVKQGFIDDKKTHLLYTAAAALGDTVLAGAGDFGAGAQYPASDPFVTGVGGTEGALDANGLPNGLQSPSGGYGAEQVWNDTEFFGVPAATGGGSSQLFPAPSYQAGLGYAKRTTPDVAYNASVAAGVLVIVSLGATPAGCGPTVQCLVVGGGTSAATPQWGGIFAIANQQRAAAGKGPLGLANPVLYANADDFHDITVGDNGVPGVPGDSAGPGYDLTTGLGSPIGSSLLPDLVAAEGSSSPCASMPGDGRGRDNKPRPCPGHGRKPKDAPNVNCQNQQLSGTYHDVNVKKGAWCDLANAMVFGDVQADRASGLGIIGTTVLGDLHADRTTGALDPSFSRMNALCNSVVFGNVEIEDSAPSAPWTVGGTACTPAGDVTGNLGSVFGNDFHFNGNQAASDVTNNTVVNNIECNHDAPVSASGGPNLYGGRAKGQCSTQLNPPPDDGSDDGQ